MLLGFDISSVYSFLWKSDPVQFCFISSSSNYGVEQLKTL